MNNLSKIDFTRRDAGIDLLRALTMFVMIFVNDLWSIHDYPRWLGHAAGGEDFMGLADVVFPCFLFVVGMSIPFAVERRFAKGFSGESTVGHILSRTFALLVMGVFIVNSEAGLSPEVPYSMGVYRILMVAGFICVWNQYPHTDSRVRQWLFAALKVIGVLTLGFLAVTFRDPEGGVFATRWWGILGLIGWSYLFCATVYVLLRGKLPWLAGVLISLIVVCILTSRMNEAWGGRAILDLPWPNFLDTFLNNVLHVDNGGLPAFTMGGILFSLLCAKYRDLDVRKKALWVAVAIVFLCAAGFVARKFWILSKIGATPPWIFYVTAIAVGMYALLTFMSERGWAGWMKVIAPAGTATLTCYLVPYFAYALMGFVGFSFPDWSIHGVAGIVKCLCFSLVVIGVTWLLGRLNIKLKI